MSQFPTPPTAPSLSDPANFDTRTDAFLAWMTTIAAQWNATEPYIQGDDAILASLSATSLVVNGNNYPSAGSLSNRTLIINGAMQVAQRGTSVAGATAGGYLTADRWKASIGLAGTWTATQEADGPSGFANSFKMECTTASVSLDVAAYLYLHHPMEGQNLQQLKKGLATASPVTLSFWVKSNKTGTYHTGLEDQDNARLRGVGFTVDVSGVWEYKTVTFEGDTVGALDNDANSSLELHYWLAAGTNYTGGGGSGAWAAAVNGNYADTLAVNLADTIGNYFQITGVQLEVGDKATPFEHRSYAQELALCQRYYQFYGGETTSMIFQGVASGAETWYPTVLFPVEMRASPTGTKQGAWVESNIADHVLQSAWLKKSHFGRKVASAASGSFYVYADSSSAKYTFDAEL